MISESNERVVEFTQARLITVPPVTACEEVQDITISRATVAVLSTSSTCMQRAVAIRGYESNAVDRLNLLNAIAKSVDR